MRHAGFRDGGVRLWSRRMDPDIRGGFDIGDNREPWPRLAIQRGCVVGGNPLVRGSKTRRTSQHHEERPEQTSCVCLSSHQDVSKPGAASLARTEYRAEPVPRYAPAAGGVSERVKGDPPAEGAHSRLTCGPDFLSGKHICVRTPRKRFGPNPRSKTICTLAVYIGGRNPHPATTGFCQPRLFRAS